MSADKVKQALKKEASREKAVILARFFKTGPGQYGAGDKFLGITVPAQRSVAKRFTDLSLTEIDKLLASSYHEHRLTALLILVDKFKRAADKDKPAIVKFYLARTNRINNWDLVDLSADKILGEWLFNNPDAKLINRLADSKNLWERRIAVLISLAFIRRGRLELIFNLAEKLLQDKEDLIHKAVGWMLREAGKRDQPALRRFLDKFTTRMPRTMLRYAIEKLNRTERTKYLKIPYSKNLKCKN